MCNVVVKGVYIALFNKNNQQKLNKPRGKKTIKSERINTLVKPCVDVFGVFSRMRFFIYQSACEMLTILGTGLIYSALKIMFLRNIRNTDSKFGQKVDSSIYLADYKAALQIIEKNKRPWSRGVSPGKIYFTFILCVHSCGWGISICKPDTRCTHSSIGRGSRNNQQAGLYTQKYVKKAELIVCKKCNQQRKPSYNKRYCGNQYCQETAMQSFEDCRAVIAASSYETNKMLQYIALFCWFWGGSIITGCSFLFINLKKVLKQNKLIRTKQHSNSQSRPWEVRGADDAAVPPCGCQMKCILNFCKQK